MPNDFIWVESDEVNLQRCRTEQMTENILVLVSSILKKPWFQQYSNIRVRYLRKSDYNSVKWNSNAIKTEKKEKFEKQSSGPFLVNLYLATDHLTFLVHSAKTAKKADIFFFYFLWCTWPFVQDFLFRLWDAEEEKDATWNEILPANWETTVLSFGWRSGIQVVLFRRIGYASAAAVAGAFGDGDHKLFRRFFATISIVYTSIFHSIIPSQVLSQNYVRELVRLKSKLCGSEI